MRIELDFRICLFLLHLHLIKVLPHTLALLPRSTHSLPAPTPTFSEIRSCDQYSTRARTLVISPQGLFLVILAIHSLLTKVVIFVLKLTSFMDDSWYFCLIPSSLPQKSVNLRLSPGGFLCCFAPDCFFFFPQMSQFPHCSAFSSLSSAAWSGSSLPQF